MALIDAETGERILPAFFTDNYLSVLPGETKTVVVEVPGKIDPKKQRVQVYGWNVAEQVKGISVQ